MSCIWLMFLNSFDFGPLDILHSCLAKEQQEETNQYYGTKCHDFETSSTLVFCVILLSMLSNRRVDDNERIEPA